MYNIVLYFFDVYKSPVLVIGFRHFLHDFPAFSTIFQRFQPFPSVPAVALCVREEHPCDLPDDLGGSWQHQGR